MTKLIPLSGKKGNGKFAIVDDDDFERINQYKWHILGHARGKYGYAAWTYRIGNRKQVCVLMHRMILNPLPGFFVDHINHDVLDNRRSNLRIVTQFENSQNSVSNKGASKYKGVIWHKGSGKWYAQIGGNGRHVHLGAFSSEIDAAKAYDKAAKQMHGIYAYLNFPDG